MKLIRINTDGSMNDISINTKLSKQNIIKYLNKNCISKGYDNLKELYKWKIESIGDILCYGWYDGPAGFENKHDLPPSGISDFIDDEDSSDKKILFGDMFIILSLNDNFKDIDVSTYANYYEMLFEGFDDCNTSDDELTEEEELTEEDKEFINDDEIDDISDDEKCCYDDEIDKLDTDEMDYSDESESDDEEYKEENDSE